MILEVAFMPYKDPEKQREAQRRYEEKKEPQGQTAHNLVGISL